MPDKHLKTVCKLRREHLPAILKHAKTMKEAAAALLEIDNKLSADVVKITGDKRCHLNYQTKFDVYGPIEDNHTEYGWYDVYGPGFKDVLDLAEKLIYNAEEEEREASTQYPNTRAHKLKKAKF
jgi:hypothetical protein